MRSLVLILLLAAAQSVQAQSIPQAVEQEYLALGGPQKALQHLKCFLGNYSNATFLLKSISGGEWIKRCNGIAGAGNQITIENQDYAVIVDHTESANERRFYILNLSQTDSPLVRKLYVAHGRYLAQASNQRLSHKRNAVNWIRYFSNQPGSNASSSGFYITGHEYRGQWSGARGDKNSLILHGISSSRNDNACARAIVLHGSTGVFERGSAEGVSRMSSGCMMLDYNWVNQVIDLIRGGGGSLHPNEHKVGGAVVYSYGDHEAQQSAGLYCRTESEDFFNL